MEGGRTKNLSVDLLEVVQRIVERKDLRRADEGEVHGVEEEDDPGKRDRGPSASFLRERRSNTHHCPR